MDPLAGQGVGGQGGRQSAGFASVSRRLWRESGYGPGDVDVAQVYENFTGPALAALIDYGFCTIETAGAFPSTRRAETWPRASSTG